jgi:hypothetical protein
MANITYNKHPSLVTPQAIHLMTIHQAVNSDREEPMLEVGM